MDANLTTIEGQRIYVPQLGVPSATLSMNYNIRSDGRDTNLHNQPSRRITDSARSIVIYFSRSGSTEVVASKVAKLLKADVLELVMKDPYPAEYGLTYRRVLREGPVSDQLALDVKLPNLAQYRTVYLAYPVWPMTMAYPMVSFLHQVVDQLAGKRLISIITHGGYGAGNGVARLQTILRDHQVSAQVDRTPLVILGNAVDKKDQLIKQWVARHQDIE